MQHAFINQIIRIPIIHKVLDDKTTPFEPDPIHRWYEKLTRAALYGNMNLLIIEKLHHKMKEWDIPFKPEKLDDQYQDNALHSLALEFNGSASSQIEIAIYLLECGVDPYQKNKDKQTPLEGFREQGSNLVATTIENWILAQQEKDVLNRITEKLNTKASPEALEECFASELSPSPRLKRRSLSL